MSLRDFRSLRHPPSSILHPRPEACPSSPPNSCASSSNSSCSPHCALSRANLLHACAPIPAGQLFPMVQPEDIVGGEWAEWYALTPLERWHASGELWAHFL